MHPFSAYHIHPTEGIIPLNQERKAGVLLPISSLPSPYGIGTFGRAAYRFIDFLRAAGQSIWQVLPVGPTSFGDSPYQSFSAFAGNPYFIDLDLLIEEGLLFEEEVTAYDWGSDAADVDYKKLFDSRYWVLQLAFSRSAHSEREDYAAFCRENADWLEDYSLYMALKFHFDNREWLLWKEEIRLRLPMTVARYRELLCRDMDFWKFCQYLFFRQWKDVQRYAHQNGILILGDLPIYVALDSADVWAHPDQFQLDASGQPVQVAGVPPDAFSDEGQLWGNPLYAWDRMEQDGFSWWKRRMAFAAQTYDVIRIDHFIGIVRYYSIPAEAKNAMQGEWKPGPGEKLTRAIQEVVDSSRIVAEDLGVVVEAVVQLREKMGYPGMKIMQFGFDGNPQNEHLPDNYTENMVIYGGTHDNETLLGYFLEVNDWVRQYVLDYLKIQRVEQIPFAMLEAGYAGIARTVIFQMQDLLELSNTARMNTPSTIGGNWRWRLLEKQMTPYLSRRLKALVREYQRESEGMKQRKTGEKGALV